MTFSRNLFTCLVLSVTATGAFAAAPASNAPPAAAAPTSKQGATNAPAATPPATAPAPAPVIPLLDGYIKDLTAAVNLTDAEKKEIETYYEDDGDQLKKILNDDTLSPLQQAHEVSKMRDARNVKIEALLDDLDRQHEFLKVEAMYRVALTELAANGGLVPPPTPPAPAPAPAPSAAPGKPAPATPTTPAATAPALPEKKDKDGAKQPE